MAASRTPERVLTAILAVELLLLSATMTAFVAIDYKTRGRVPHGVTVAGRELGRMSESQATAAIDQVVSAPMMSPVTVTADGRSWTLDPTGIVVVDNDGMLRTAYSSKRAAPLIARVQNEITGRPLPAVVEPKYSVDSSAVAAWVAQVASQVDHKPQNAERSVVRYKIKIKPSMAGVRVDQPAAVAEIVRVLSAEAALGGQARAVTLPAVSIRPKVHESSFKTALVVSLSKCRIYVYRGDGIVKSYPCAPGRPGFPTPTGDFKVDSRQRFAPWINPGTPWAKSMPPYIAPGPYNPMGVTKTGIDYPGVFMHGIPPSEFGSIGTHASHGCMRMFPSDALDLYNRVRIGDPVFIRP